ncbi:DUF2141 domain-containing protein [Maribacter sp. ANRC-HE7]|uniref:DUF2141 domain-containing protein n=1 Tax=Maribacter aquimaris TaxID=2737171 RepID=A0ABR7UYJ3_9FLAO|nr:DUF2141 domain-containing protein [Maribacter aquimaris]MBD0776705.1 DUF2141 domain-containing protein [Maribacter aquimaris]
MKTIGLILSLVFTSFIATAQQAEEGVKVTVNIENVLNANGKILASLHNSETFLKGEGLDHIAMKSTKGTLTLTFEGVVPGTYAIMVLHDENDNQRMDFEANGMPKENYATTGVMALYGPPSFDSSKFEVSHENLELHIRF